MSLQDSESHFDELREEWHDATMFHSNTSIIMEHRACRDIVAMGKKVIPWVIQIMERGDIWIAWSLLLSEITGISPDDTGANTYEDGFVKSNVAQMAEWWIDWAYQNNIVPVSVKFCCAECGESNFTIRYGLVEEYLGRMNFAMIEGMRLYCVNCWEEHDAQYLERYLKILYSGKLNQVGAYDVSKKQ